MQAARGPRHNVLESDQSRMSPALLLIAQLYRIEKQARELDPQTPLTHRRSSHHSNYRPSALQLGSYPDLTPVERMTPLAG